MIVVMKGSRSCEMVWSIVEGGSNGQEGGLQDKITFRVSPAILEMCK